MTGCDATIHSRIASMVEQAEVDPSHAHDLFNYTWTMVCVQRGLLRVVSEAPATLPYQIVVEEVRSGRHRLVAKPQGLDGDVEQLAVKAMARILAGSRPQG
jgi:hypothetical protein